MENTDPVRIEVETALSKGITTIPILVGKTNMPKPEQLPESLKNFAFINAAPVDTGRDFHRDLNRVIVTINGIIGEPSDTLERAALSMNTTVERERASAIPAPPEVEWIVDTGAGDGERIAMAGVAAELQRDPELAGSDKRANRFRTISIAAIICCSGAGWWFWTTRSGAVRLTSVAPTIATSPSADLGRGGTVATVVAPAVQPAAAPSALAFKGADSSTADPGADAVRAFYTALVHGDGVAAAALVVPERQKGGQSAQEMTQFYSGNFQPLQLVSVLPYGQNAYQATYSFQRTSKSVVCANSVIVAVPSATGAFSCKVSMPATVVSGPPTARVR